jgi:SsrA-binding protein
MPPKKKKSDESVVENRRARHDYHIIDTLETGIMLAGSEVKPVRSGAVSLAEGYVKVELNPPRLLLFGVTIGEYQPAGARQHKPDRARTLLAHRKEIESLHRQVMQKGMTIVPLRLYFKSGFAKVLIATAQGKAAHDKRHAIAEREAKRAMDRAISKRL